MNKKDVQQLFSEIKSQKAKVSAKNETLFTPPRKKGCSTCGKVTWKPNKNNN